MDRSSSTIMDPYGGPNGFNENSKIYKCCCGCCHVRVGAIVIGVLELLYLAYELPLNIYLVMSNEPLPATGALTVAIVLHVMMPLAVLISIVLMFVAIGAQKHLLVIPHLVIQVIWMLFLLLAIILASLAVVLRKGIFAELIGIGQPGHTVEFPSLGRPGRPPFKFDIENNKILIENELGETITYGPGDKIFIGIAFGLIAVATIFLILQIWWFFVIRKLYRFLKDKKSHARKHMMLMRLQYPAHNNNGKLSDLAAFKNDATFGL